MGYPSNKKKKSKKRKQRILVSSDGHGRYREFMTTINKCNFDPRFDFLIYLGDAIDRGPDGKKFLRKLMSWHLKGYCEFILGNHERMLLDVLEEKFPLYNYLLNGGRPTLKSFGIDFELENYTLEEIRELIGEDLIEWLSQRPLYYEIENYIFVHAGVRPGIEMKNQVITDLLWIRKDFFNYYKGEKTVVFGHTPVKRIHNSYNLWRGYNCIGIDTGAGGKGYISIVDIKKVKVYQNRVWNNH